MFQANFRRQWHRLQPQSSKHSRGLTLIELMVSIAIGLVLVLSMLVLYINIARNQSQLSNSGRQVENGKFALQLLQEDLRHAGFWGDYLPRYDDKGLPTPADVPNALPNPCLSYSAANWNADYIRNLMGIAVQGYDAVPADCSTLLTNKANNTDILLIRHVENCTTGQPNCDAEIAGRLYFQSSRCSTEIASGNRFILNTTGLTLKSNINCPAVSPATDTTAAKHRFISHFYHVRDFSVTSGDGIPTLMRSTFNLSGSTLAFQPPQPLIEGIQGFRVEYGIDNLGSNGAAVSYAGTVNRGDGTPDVYITCPKAGGTACDVNDMFNVVSARIHVLARNLEPTPGHTDTKKYILAGVEYGPFNDAFVRRVYSTTVRLMNPAGRREP
ncbi:MAG: PilW family protein [Hydrogenophaga sp.]|uniref:PilW family protein n=1 Tax=Hydrogenophaga sp. TaxID=1904254 RepID=UPI002756C83B|nr:PilW family protein [Hydrogenophaga sp.]MDP2419571.1 PilW family protein [Hydrogenophaga sp.]MDZ4187883.1 PilW family protein [Hydrogenophaga sp.]